MRKILSLFGIVFAALVIGCVYFIYALSIPVQKTGVGTIRVEKGDSAKIVSEKLQIAGLVSHAPLFNIYLSLVGFSDKIKTGEYKFLHPIAPFQIANSLITGVPDERMLRIIEGWALRDIDAYFEKEKIATPEQFARARGEVRGNFAFIPLESTLEGYLFPDSYRIFPDASIVDVMTKMVENFQQKIQPLEEEIRASGRTLHEILTLASILEQEVQTPKDRRIVADLFLRRIRQGMPLQADSTVNYITGKNDPRARYADIAIDSPYNTYKYKGLPPGPISNPGIDSILAALRPQKNEFLFFLTAPDGKVYYSKTFDEHIAKRNIYLK